MKKLFLFSVALVVFLAMSQVAYTIYVQSRGIPAESTYVGSSTCRDCHNPQSHDWHESLHSKMMRPAKSANNLEADISEEGNIPFDPTDIIWVIGSKWEQQFMGQEDGHETVLPGAWLVDKQEWKLQGWDGWQVPQPLQRCHGCHTVGLNVKTGEFVEPSIGCESCHGPGSWHVETDGIGKIHSGLGAQMCGQCHTRGNAVDGEHFFPVNYKPWQNLEDFFVESKPDPLQNTSHWWANGHAKKRHQEYYAWKQGGHANSLKTLTENYDGRLGEVTPQCLTCHAGEAAIVGDNHRFELEEVEHGITCTACHNVHGSLDEPRMTCSTCHDNGAYSHKSESLGDHIPCPPNANVQCVDCHMPLTGWNGGDYTLHSHTPGIIPPSDTREVGVPNSCANGGCHSEKDVDWLEAAFYNHYK